MNESEEIKTMFARYQELKIRLQPPSPEISEIDHLKAQIRYGMDTLYTAYFNLLEAAEPLLKTETEPVAPLEENVKKRALHGKQFFEKLMNEESDQPWDIMVSPEHFSYLRHSLTDMHDGNCTAIAVNCMRCDAERAYGLKNTATWSKSDGAKMLKEFQELYRQKKNLELAAHLSHALPEKVFEEKKNKI